MSTKASFKHMRKPKQDIVMQEEKKSKFKILKSKLSKIRSK